MFHIPLDAFLKKNYGEENGHAIKEAFRKDTSSDTVQEREHIMLSLDTDVL